jgi:hypothetical protein
MVGVSQNPILGIVLRSDGGNSSAQKQFLMFLRKMCFSGGSSFFLMFPMNFFFIPVRDEGAYFS